MSTPWAKLGWVLAVVFLATTSLYINKYAEALRESTIVRHEFDSLQVRIEKQAEQNELLAASLRTLSEQLSAAQARLESLSQAAPPPAAP